MYLPKEALTDSDLVELGIQPKNILKGVYIDHNFDRMGIWLGPRFFRGKVCPIYSLLSV